MPSTPAPTRRALLGATAWATPVIIVGTAAPALAASGTTVTSTLEVQRLQGEVVENGLVTNQGSAAVVVTIRISADLAPGTSATITGGAESGTSGWVRTYFNWTDGAGTDRTSAYWEGYTTAPLAAGASILTPAITFYIDDPAATGTARLTVSVPAPATATSPAPKPFGAFAGLAGGRAAPAPRGFPEGG